MKFSEEVNNRSKVRAASLMNMMREDVNSFSGKGLS